MSDPKSAIVNKRVVRDLNRAQFLSVISKIRVQSNLRLAIAVVMLRCTSRANDDISQVKSNASFSAVEPSNF